MVTLCPLILFFGSGRERGSEAVAKYNSQNSGHWEKEDIEFVAARGMFATALGRRVGVNLDNY